MSAPNPTIPDGGQSGRRAASEGGNNFSRLMSSLLEEFITTVYVSVRPARVPSPLTQRRPQQGGPGLNRRDGLWAARKAQVLLTFIWRGGRGRSRRVSSCSRSKSFSARRYEQE